MANVLTKDEFVADLRDLLSETDVPETVSEAVVVSASAPSVVSEASGEELEKKAREKRKGKKSKTKRLGSGRNPFKHKDKLGLGPRGHHHNKTGAWKCKCPTAYACTCRSGSKIKHIKIKKPWKSEYNAEYKKFRKKQVY